MQQNEKESMSQVEIALQIALDAHKGQYDLNGAPAIVHALAVAVQGNNEREIVAGLLHDVVRDSDWTFDDLLEAGIEPRQVDAVRVLTRRIDEQYVDYIRRIAWAHDPVVINVKCNDLDHNLRRDRKGDHLRLLAQHNAARRMLHPINGDEDAAWDLLFDDDPDEAKFWQAKFDFQVKEMSIEQATADAGITVEQYMRFFHPDRTEY